MQNVNLSVWLRKKRCHEWCLFTNKSTPGHSRLSVRTQWYMGDEWSGNCIFHPVPLCLCSPYTHYTTGNTCNASRHDFWQWGGGNNFRTPAPLLFRPPPPSARQTRRLDALMSAIDLVAGDNSFHRCDMPWWSGAPWTPQLISGPELQHASAGEAACRTLGESIDLPRVDGQRDADAILFWRFLHFRGIGHNGPQLSAAICQILAHWLGEFTVY